MVALTERGICGLAFVQKGDRQEIVQDLRRRWTNADLMEDPERTAPVVERIFPLAYGDHVAPLHLYLNGTNFNKSMGGLASGSGRGVDHLPGIARSLGMPGAARAVGQAWALTRSLSSSPVIG